MRHRVNPNLRITGGEGGEDGKNQDKSQTGEEQQHATIGPSSEASVVTATQTRQHQPIAPNLRIDREDTEGMGEEVEEDPNNFELVPEICSVTAAGMRARQRSSAVDKIARLCRTRRSNKGDGMESLAVESNVPGGDARAGVGHHHKPLVAVMGDSESAVGDNRVGWENDGMRCLVSENVRTAMAPMRTVTGRGWRQSGGSTTTVRSAPGLYHPTKKEVDDDERSIVSDVSESRKSGSSRRFVGAKPRHILAVEDRNKPEIMSRTEGPSSSQTSSGLSFQLDLSPSPCRAAQVAGSDNDNNNKGETESTRSVLPYRSQRDTSLSPHRTTEVSEDEVGKDGETEDLTNMSPYRRIRHSSLRSRSRWLSRSPSPRRKSEVASDTVETNGETEGPIDKSQHRRFRHQSPRSWSRQSSRQDASLSPRRITDPTGGKAEKAGEREGYTNTSPCRRLRRLSRSRRSSRSPSPHRSAEVADVGAEKGSEAEDRANTSPYRRLSLQSRSRSRSRCLSRSPSPHRRAEVADVGAEKGSVAEDRANTSPYRSLSPRSLSRCMSRSPSPRRTAEVADVGAEKGRAAEDRANTSPYQRLSSRSRSRRLSQSPSPHRAPEVVDVGAEKDSETEDRMNTLSYRRLGYPSPRSRSSPRSANPKNDQLPRSDNEDGGGSDHNDDHASAKRETPNMEKTEHGGVSGGDPQGRAPFRDLPLSVQRERLARKPNGGRRRGSSLKGENSNEGESNRRNLDKRTARLRYSDDFRAEVKRRLSKREGAESGGGSQVSERNKHRGEDNVEYDPYLRERNGISVFVRKRPLFGYEEERGDYDVVSVQRSRSLASTLNSDDSSHGDTGQDFVVVHNCFMHPDMRRMFVRPTSFPCSAAFGDDCTDDDVYEHIAAPMVRSAARGGVATVLMYGQVSIM